MAARISDVANQGVIFDLEADAAAALVMVARRAGGWFDPSVAQTFAHCGRARCWPRSTNTTRGRRSSRPGRIRPQRSTRTPEQAAEVVAEQAAAGRLDADGVRAITEVAGQTPQRITSPWPASRFVPEHGLLKH